MGFEKSGTGEILRAERLRQRRSIEYIARETRISPRMLDSIERDDLEAIPGLLFARNFVKQYAMVLGLDPQPLLARLPALDIEAAPLPQLPERRREKPAWNPAWNGAISSLVWLALGVAAAGAAYVHFNKPLQKPADLLVAAAPKPAADAPAANANAGPARDTSAVPAASPAPAAQAPAPAAENPGATVPAALRDVADTRPRGGANSISNAARKVNVVISARADSWIEVSEQGKAVFSGILKPNESREFSSDDAIKLIAGNAGGITVSLNGHALDPLGATGQVKVLSLTGAGPRAPAPASQPVPSRL